jgi:retron-type reverse transcriptase
MGLFDFLKNLFGAKPPALPRQATAPAPQTNWPAPQASSSSRQPVQRRDVKLHLDAAQFQPLQSDQIKAQAEGQRFSFWEFGRRDRIPSAIDLRTKLIDQGMVGQGIITPEELVKIHELGEKMDELRPDLAGAHQLAERVVQADKEERARIKAQKKAAAEQRKREHAARVAHNRATDIVHLGRGVSKGLSDRRSNLEKLTSLGLPILSSPTDVAAALGIAIPRLRWLAYHAEASTVSHYVQFFVPKKSGGERMLSAPHKNLANSQEWILARILNPLRPHEASHGFVKKRSTVTNASPHVGASVVINCDLTDFFPSITVHRVIGLFHGIGYSPAVATILALLVTECPRRKVIYNNKAWWVATGKRGLPQGACTSPMISNLIAKRLDSRLFGLCRKMGLVYTRYADDLTVSSSNPTDRIGYLLARIRHIAQDEGFEINEKKTRVLKKASRQCVTGIVVNEKPSTPRRLRRQMRAILHNAKKTSLAEQNRQRRKGFKAYLKGMISYISMVNREQGARLLDRFSRITGD